MVLISASALIGLCISVTPSVKRTSHRVAAVSFPGDRNTLARLQFIFRVSGVSRTCELFSHKTDYDPL